MGGGFKTMNREINTDREDSDECNGDCDTCPQWWGCPNSYLRFNPVIDTLFDVEGGSD